MKPHRVLSVIVAVLMLSGVAATQGNDSAEARLRAAMDKETVDGDLKGAIDGYKRVISQRGASREVVAQALLRLGMAYEKQGDAEARKSYERLVREFADLPSVVQQARGRMAVADAVATGPTLRRLCSECDGTISSDGRFLLFARNGGLAVRDLGSGTVRQVIPAPANGGIGWGRFSPDGRQLAYSRWSQSPNRGQLMVANADGSGSRAVSDQGWLGDWSPDASRVLLVQPARSGEPGNLVRLSWVRLSDGTVQTLPTARRNLDFPHVSPDGRFIAFSASPDVDGNMTENVHIMASDGSGETRLSASTVYQEAVGWSPDGRYFLYGEYPRGGAPALWAVPLANGRVQGPPVSVKQFDQGSSILGVSPTGTVYYRYASTTGDLYTALMDPASGRVVSIPAVVPTPGAGVGAAWSPDSRRIAYLTGVNPHMELRVFSLEAGQDRRIPANVSFVNSLCWTSGAESVLTNRDTGQAQNRYETLRVDLATGETRPVFPGARSFRLWNCTDRTAANFDTSAVKVRDLATAAETELYRLKRPTRSYGASKLSPDGRFVTFLESVDPETSVLLVVPSGGGPARELARVKAPAQLQEIDGHAWSRDSRFVYFLKRADGKAPYELYRVPTAGGAEEEMGLKGLELRGIEIAPDAQKMFFVMGSFNRPEIWAMDNFLPLGN